MKKALLFFWIVFICSGVSFGKGKNIQLSIYGGMSCVLEYGSEDDYVLGKNDFPVTPTHISACLGTNFAYFFSERFGINLDASYFFKSEITLEDPSDQDTVDIDTSNHVSLTLNLHYSLSKEKFRPYLYLGGGFDKLLAKDRTYISEYGYKIDILVPENTIDPLVQAGAGIQYFINPGFGISTDIRYVFLFAEPDNIRSFNAYLSAFIRF